MRVRQSVTRCCLRWQEHLSQVPASLPRPPRSPLLPKPLSWSHRLPTRPPTCTSTPISSRCPLMGRYDWHLVNSTLLTLTRAAMFGGERLYLGDSIASTRTLVVLDSPDYWGRGTRTRQTG